MTHLCMTYLCMLREERRGREGEVRRRRWSNNKNPILRIWGIICVEQIKRRIVSL